MQSRQEALASRQVPRFRRPRAADKLHDEANNPAGLRDMAQELGTDSLAVDPLVRDGFGLEEWYLPRELSKFDEHWMVELWT